MESREPEPHYEEEPNHNHVDLHDNNNNNPSSHNNGDEDQDQGRSQPLTGDGASPGKIFVGGLARDTTSAQFFMHFGKYGEIIDSVIMKDRLTGQPRGFGFITYADPSVVDKVMDDTHLINEKYVEIKRTIPKGAASSKDFKTKKIFVGGIPTSVDEDEFKDFFSKFGEVKEHQIMRDHSSNRSRGFGFVTFETDEAVDELLSKGNRIDFAGTKVEIKKAEPKKANPPPSTSKRYKDSRTSSYGGGIGDSYSGGYGGAASYRAGSGAYGGRAGAYGGYGASEYGGYGGYGAGAMGAAAAYRRDIPYGYSGRYGTAAAGYSRGYDMGGGGYGGPSDAYGSYGGGPGSGSGYGGSYDSALGGGYGGGSGGGSMYGGSGGGSGGGSMYGGSGGGSGGGSMYGGTGSGSSRGGFGGGAGAGTGGGNSRYHPYGR